MTLKELLNHLKSQDIHSWFELGYFIDYLKENRAIPTVKPVADYKSFLRRIQKGGIGFITFSYGVDGVTIETEKYVKSIKSIISGVPIHYITGEFYPESYKLIDKDAKKCEIPEIQGFDNWDLYEDFFHTKLQRGSKKYNELIINYWKDVLLLVKKLGTYIDKNNIQLLYLLNVCSNPGNVALSLALVILSEYLGIPVINNCHDFYWEGGKRKSDIIREKIKPGPRDFFFTNSGIGEFFSQINVLFPWRSRSWLSLTINEFQSNHVMKSDGHNPSNITEIGTSIDIDSFKKIRISRNEILGQMKAILSRYGELLNSYKVSQVINDGILDYDYPRPVLVGSKSKVVNDFTEDNMILLHPIRIMPRKNIHLSFELVDKLFNIKEFKEKFSRNKSQKLTIVVAGPLPLGQKNYFKKLLKQFGAFLRSIDPSYRDRIYLAFLFAEFHNKQFIDRYESPLSIPELYSAASLILLLSSIESRGLPIIEAPASGKLIFCKRYDPKIVYSGVIGENLSEDMRLRVFEFDKYITRDLVKKISTYLIDPLKFTKDIRHNNNVIKERYSTGAMIKDFENIFYKLYLQLSPNKKFLDEVREEFKGYRKLCFNTDKNIKDILNTDNRNYLPGYGRLHYMYYIKSLIDPSFFRVEESRIRGKVYAFAWKLVRNYLRYRKIDTVKYHDFYLKIDNIFKCWEGEVKIQHDHSFSYRHRNRKNYLYQEFTVQEILGLVNLIFIKTFKPEAPAIDDAEPCSSRDWGQAIFELSHSAKLKIDNRDRLIKKLQSNIPIALFPCDDLVNEFEVIITRSIKARLGLKSDEKLSEKLLKKNAKKLQKIYVFCQKLPLLNCITGSSVRDFVSKTTCSDIKLLFKYGVCEIVETKQVCVGIHFIQIGTKAIEKLKFIKKEGGILVTTRLYATVMTDFADIDRFHIGKAEKTIIQKMMGIPADAGYVQFVPAGVRLTFSYPVPTQTAKDFDNILNGKLYKELCSKLGEDAVLESIKKDQETSGSPVKTVLKNLKNRIWNKRKKCVECEFVSGIYDDGMPYNGAMAAINIANSNKKWEFRILSSHKTKSVPEFVEDFNKTHVHNSQIAWNGGYILNSELIGKLRLPKRYIGAPLGLIISNGKILSAPLFNKPAFLIYEDGTLDIKRVNCNKGVSISADGITLDFPSNSINSEKNRNGLCLYNLNHKKKFINGKGRMIIKVSGNIIKKIIQSKKNEKIKILPVGLTFVIPKKMFPKSWAVVEKELTIKLNGFDEKILHAVEAGPLLLDKGKVCIDMEKEGWNTDNSINTQAARIDYLDMRGPKIAIGIDKNENLSVLAINGRIRESVGATHADMANILKKFGMIKAMGFDPGGSSTLVVGNKVLNISPYNSRFEDDEYALPPETRKVSNMVIGWIR